MRRNRNEKRRRQRRKKQRRDIDSGDLLIESPFFMHYDVKKTEYAGAEEFPETGCSEEHLCPLVRKWLPGLLLS